MLKKYKIVRVLPEGKIYFKDRYYDLSTLDDKTAEVLYENKCSYIEKVEKVDKPKKGGKEEVSEAP